MSRLIAFFGAALLYAFFVVATALSGPAPAGQTIANRAAATYFNTRLGIVETVRSNTVEVEVLPVPGLLVTGGQDLRLGRGGMGEHGFLVENTGNVPLVIDLSLLQSAEDDFDTSGPLMVDADGDGKPGGTDREAGEGGILILAPGESLRFYHPFRAPFSVNAEDIARLTLAVTGTAPDGRRLTGAADASVAIVANALTVGKEASHRAEAGEIDYVLRVRNNSETDLLPYAAIDGTRITVDGLPVAGIVVRDTVPLNTVFVSGADAGGYRFLHHRRGDPEHAYLGTAPEAPDTVDAVAFLHERTYAVGRSSDLRFTVAVPGWVADTAIENTAAAFVTGTGGTRRFPSNTVATPIGGPGNSIAFRDGGDEGGIEATGFGDPFRLAVGAASCNVTRGIDVIALTLRTSLAGDIETVAARETGPNTGRFLTAPLAALRADRATPRNDVLESAPGDTARAASGAACLGAGLETMILVQPGGFVFDSLTNEPVAGARVRVFAAAAAPGAAPLARSVSDASGYYALGTLAPGRYRLVVLPPDLYAFASERMVFDGFARRVHVDRSYGRAFLHAGGPFAGTDIPLDPAMPAPVGLDKRADRREVRRGGTVLYTLDARNNMMQALIGARITDTPPGGFRLVAGSARLDDAPLAAEPVVDGEGVITFALGDMAPETGATLTYALRAGPAARQGRAANAAVLGGIQAGTGAVRTSPVARATVRVDDRGGVFTDEAVVIGRVFLDRDGNGIQRDGDGPGEDEPGVPGVKIVTSSGLSVVTDALGRYSLFGLPARTTVLALAPETLPWSARPLATDIDDAAAPGSRFVDLDRGDVRTETFALDWTPRAAAEVARRRAAGIGLTPDQSRLRDDLPLTFERSRRLGSRSESARLTTTEATRGGSVLPVPVLSRPASLADDALIEAEEIDLAALGPAPGFVGLADGMRVASRAIRVRIKSPAEAVAGLEVNGVPVPETAIGTRKVDTGAGVQLQEYVAIGLVPGDNRLTLTVSDPFGNVRERHAITVSAPGDPAGLRLVAPRAIPADPAARVPVIVRVVDADGRPVSAPVEVTLDADRGTWDAADIRESEPGLQVLVDRGEATFDFVPPDLVGTETLRVTGHLGGAEARIAVTPDLGNRVFVGVIEGAVGIEKRGTRAIETIAGQEFTTFEQTAEGLRGQLYLKGKIRGDALLTLRYDSDQDTGDRLFRDIRRDEFYPVYGDNSERGFDAQSSSKLYVKVEKGTSYMLYGDLAVEAQSDAVQLGAYRRSVTGGRVHVERGPVTVDLFVAETDQEQRVIEIPGRGVSGPYDIDLGGIVDGSEIVELLVRDRDQPDVIRSAQPQQRLGDYVLDFFAGTLIFNRPVPRLDDSLNPVSIRVTYETEEGAGGDYLVYGGEVRVEPVEGIVLGYRGVRSDASRASDERRSVQSVFAEADLRGWGAASVELSATRDRLGRTGRGARADYAWRDANTSIRIEGAVTEETFDAPNSSVRPGREELRAIAERRAGPRTTLGAEALYSRDRATHDRRVGAEIVARHALWSNVEVTVGGRAVHSDRDGRDGREVYSAIAGLAWRPTVLPGLALRGEAEQDFVDTDARRLVLGADYQATPDLRLYALTEISSAESGRFGIGDDGDLDFTTKAGAEYRLNRAVSGFSEYRADPSTGLNGGIAQGLRGQWKPTDALSLRAGVEHVEPLAGSDDRETSATLGAAYLDEARGLALRGDVEVDRDARGYGWFANTSLAWAVNDGLTLLARNRFAVDDRGKGRLRDRLRLGAAWRPARDSRVQVLGLYEFETDEEGTLDERAHRWSAATTVTVHPRLRLTGKYAGERFEVDGAGFEDAGLLHLARAGAEFDVVPRRFALGGNVMAFTDDDARTLVTGAGIELKSHVMENVQLGIGYNHVDVQRDRLRDLYRSGFYLRLKVKLDHDVWNTIDSLGMTGYPIGTTHR